VKNGKVHRKKQRRVRITDNGRKNLGIVGRIRGDLSEEFVNGLLAMLAGENKIQSFHKTTQNEDREQHADFVAILASGRKVGIQVKSSDYGAAKFRMEEKIEHARRDYPVTTFVPNQLALKKDEAKRLIKELNRFESSLKKEAIASI
jgi:hypothetical protein